MNGKAEGTNGQMHNIEFNVDVNATSKVIWENDDYPSGWNYSSDQPTYTNKYFPVIDDVIITRVKFTDDMEFIVDGSEYKLSEVQHVISGVVLKKLLNPEIYKNIIEGLFNKEIKNVEPPEQDFAEPEKDYDR